MGQETKHRKSRVISSPTDGEWLRVCARAPFNFTRAFIRRFRHACALIVCRNCRIGEFSSIVSERTFGSQISFACRLNSPGGYASASISLFDGPVTRRSRGDLGALGRGWRDRPSRWIARLADGSCVTTYAPRHVYPGRFRAGTFGLEEKTRDARSL